MIYAKLHQVEKLKWRIGTPLRPDCIIITHLIQCDTVSIGSAYDCDIQVLERGVCPHSANIRFLTVHGSKKFMGFVTVYGPKGIFVESSFVNDKAVVKDGSLLDIGPCLYVLEMMEYPVCLILMLDQP